MDLVFAPASAFPVPQNDNDIIGFWLPQKMCEEMRALEPGNEALSFAKTRLSPILKNYLSGLTTTTPQNPAKIDFIIFDHKHNPKYSTPLVSGRERLFLPESGFKPVHLTRSITRDFYDMVHNSTDEFSGIVRSNGTLKIQKGHKDESAPQNRDIDSLTFHTHPASLYHEFNTNVGWPSRSDSEIHKNNERHIVPSREGMYLMRKKTTCSPPGKRGRYADVDQLERVVNGCSWLLLPWNGDWIVY
jgi:hypothetical protein